ncbi:Conserved_hypothetical protein [Hexamita inflata]|uniref:Microbial-type PARG catalytic domain-containing protein n=1 Tax=Hexamita inflata TaxID=28002 RepID=A0AA86UPW2_9EUKA|nr:Conserved hypothetical protein [Hexamita inflata]
MTETRIIQVEDYQIDNKLQKNKYADVQIYMALQFNAQTNFTFIILTYSIQMILYAQQYPKTIIFRDINLQFLENPVEVTIITCPSIITNQQLNRDRSLKLMKQRIDNIMTLIKSLDADVAIFGAFGCEGNSADPQFVAQCFKENINNNRCCKRNIFAIEADENVQAFKHVFESDN